MPRTARELTAAVGAIAVVAVLAGCAGTPAAPSPAMTRDATPPAAQPSPSHRLVTPGALPGATTLPLRIPITSPPTVVRADASGAPAIVPGPVPGSPPGAGATPPADADALDRARQWITAATPPPGARTLAAAPAGAPQPASLPSCDWLVRATRWWSTDASDADAAKAWLTAHPVTGLVADGTMQDSSGLSALTERSPQHAGDSLSFEFIPRGRGAVTIRVDAVLVPHGADCLSSGGNAGSGAP